MNQIDEFDKLRKQTNLGTRQFVEKIDDLLRGWKARIPRNNRSVFKLFEIYGAPTTMRCAREIADQFRRTIL